MNDSLFTNSSLLNKCDAVIYLFESNDSEQRNSEDEDVELFNMPNLSLLGILLPEEQHDSESCCSVDSEDDLMELLNIPKDHLLDSNSPERNV